jgi:hypothetical protein
MNKHLKVPKGKDTLAVWVAGHTYIRLMNAKGQETFRFDSPGKHVTALVPAGRCTIETDGKLGKIEFASLSTHRSGQAADATKPSVSKAKRR